MMIYSVLTAFVVMVCATLAQHLGLTEAMAKVASKIASCSMCCTFWSCVLLLVMIGEDPAIAAMLSILFAYASHWFVLILIWLQTKYNQLWQKLTRHKR